MKRTGQLVIIIALAALLAGLTIADDPPPPPPPAEGRVKIARLLYADKQKTQCFSNKFLYAVKRETNINVQPQFEDVAVDSPDLFNYPMVLFFGECSFQFNDAQVENLGNYLSAGGFVLASSSCMEQKWNESFEKTIARVLPDHSLEPLPMDHPLFSTIYQVSAIKCARSKDAQLFGLYIEGRLAMIWCPIDLRDPGSMGAECCCCGTNYVRNAQQINANILAYVLTH